MKRFMSIALLAGASLVAPALAAPADTPQAAFERYRTQINQHDFDRLAREVIATDAVFVFTDKVHRGIDAARREFNATWSTLPDEVYTMSEPEWLALDADSALVAFRYGYRGTLASGKPLQGGGRGTNLFVRTPAGWRLKYEHLSHDPAPPAKKA